MRLTFLTLLVISMPSLSYAGEASKPSEQPSTRIEADNEAGLIRFFIKGELEAVIDENGLHVRDDISYDGKIIDTGSNAFDKKFKENGDAHED